MQLKLIFDKLGEINLECFERGMIVLFLSSLSKEPPRAARNLINRLFSVPPTTKKVFRKLMKIYCYNFVMHRVLA